MASSDLVSVEIVNVSWDIPQGVIVIKAGHTQNMIYESNNATGRLLQEVCLKLINANRKGLDNIYLAIRNNREIVTDQHFPLPELELHANMTVGALLSAAPAGRSVVPSPSTTTTTTTDSESDANDTDASASAAPEKQEPAKRPRTRKKKGS